MPEPGFVRFPVTKKNGSQQSVTHNMLLYITLVLQRLLNLYSGQCAEVKRKSLPCQKGDNAPPAQLLGEIKSHVVNYGWKLYVLLLSNPYHLS